MVLEIGESGIEDTCTCHADVVAVQEDFREFGRCARIVAVVECQFRLVFSVGGGVVSRVLFGNVFEHHVYMIVSKDSHPKTCVLTY